jgi:two-component system cell cycle sensor histidine kinase/response regulator CckA
MGSRRDLMDKRETKRASHPVDDALRKSEASYRRLFETAQDGILIIDADTGRITDANPFLVNMLGYVHEEFIGKALWNFGPFKDIRKSKSAFQELMNNGYIRYEHLPLETRDGRHVEVEFVSNIYHVGRKRTIQCNIRDNSQRKQAENARLKAEAQLKQAQKMEAIATLAGGLAHQFTNALTIITGGLDLLEEDVLNKKKDTYIQLMKESAGLMSRLTRELLAYSRGGKYSAETISLSDLVSDNLPLLKSVLKPSISLEIDLPSGLPQISADRSQMQMALLAILSNAAEAIESQGLIRIICRQEVMTEERAKAFAGLVPGIYVSLTVRDNGKGMDDETRSRVFEPFFTTQFFGRGLGLAAVYGIVKNHDGWISIESQANQGTTVCIYLPAIGGNPNIGATLQHDSALRNSEMMA